MANPWRTQRPPLGGPLTQFHLFEGSVGVVPGALAGVSGAGHAAGDLGLLGAQVYQQGGDLGLEVPRGRVPQDAQQVKLQVLADAADLRLGQRGGQVGCGGGG